MIFVLQNRDGFRGFQDQFLGDLAQFGDDFFQGTMVGDGSLHLFGLSGRQPASDRFSADFSCPDPCAGRLWHDTSLTQGFEAPEAGSQGAVSRFELSDFLRCQGGFFHVFFRGYPCCQW